MLAELVLAATINIVLDQCGTLTPEHCRLAVTEMAEVWRGAGVEVVPRLTGEPSIRSEPSVSLRIVTFSINTNARGEPILGWVDVEPGGRTIPVVFVSLPALSVALADADVAGIPFSRLTTNLQSRLTARAIGRIAAHELGHFLLQRAGHPKNGLMRSSYAARDLTGAWLGPFQLGDHERSLAVAQIAALAAVHSQTVTGDPVVARIHQHLHDLSRPIVVVVDSDTFPPSIWNRVRNLVAFRVHRKQPDGRTLVDAATYLVRDSQLYGRAAATLRNRTSNHEYVWCLLAAVLTHESAHAAPMTEWEALTAEAAQLRRCLSAGHLNSEDWMNPVSYLHKVEAKLLRPLLEHY